MNTIEEKIGKAASLYGNTHIKDALHLNREPDEVDKFMNCFDTYDIETAFEQGANWALSHQWISVEEALPEDDIQALVMLDDCNYPYKGLFCRLRWEVESADEILFSDVDDIRVTHWMPIPPLPEARKEGKE